MLHRIGRLTCVGLVSLFLPALTIAKPFDLSSIAHDGGVAASNASSNASDDVVLPKTIKLTYNNPLKLPSMNVTTFDNTTIDTHHSSPSAGHGNGSSLHARDTHLLQPRQRFNIPLRVMAVGDSITKGLESSDSNGYRLDLRNLLTQLSGDIDFVGSQADGDNNPDNQHEGFGGYKILDIQNAINADHAVFRHPNVVLLHAGTNDLWQEATQEERDGAPQRLGELIESIVCEDYDAIVLVARIVGNNYVQDRVNVFNAAVPGVAYKYAQLGFKVRVADMSSIQGSQLKDGVHPNDAGYQNMAQIWYDTLNNVPPDWFTPPREAGSGGPSRAETCSRDSLNWAPAQGGGIIALGAHVPGDTGVKSRGRLGFTAGWTDAGIVALGIGRQGGTYQMADIDGDGRADYLWLDPDTGAITAYMNRGLKNWQFANNGNPIALGVGPAANVLLADMNGDGKVDYIYLQDDTINIYWNLGPLRPGGPHGWGGPASFPWGTDLSRYNLLFLDYDGNGCDDYVVVSPGNVYTIWLNDCTGNSQGMRGSSRKSTIPSYDDGYLYSKCDINGDGVDELCVIHTNGGITAGIQDFNNDGLYAFTSEYNFALGVGAPGSEIIIADYDGDGKDDYWIVKPNGGQVHLYLNAATEGASAGNTIESNGGDYGLHGLGAAVRLADLDGDGRDDYIAVGPNSEAVAFVNQGPLGPTGWSWGYFNGGQLVALGVGATREAIQFADVNGDGRADYLVVDSSNGAVTCFLNGGLLSNGAIAWTGGGQIAAGVGQTGWGTRFADLTGNGRADYIWLDPDGRASVYLNVGTGDTVNAWAPVNNFQPIANGVGGKREDIRFADVDGDGLADYLWVHPENGAVDVWFNGGQSGDSWIWYPGGQIAAGIGYPGNAVRFARFGVSGRADYIAITETTGALVAYYSTCGKVIVIDDGSPPGTCGKSPYPPLAYPTCSDSDSLFCDAYGCDDPPFTEYVSQLGASRKRSVSEGGVDRSHHEAGLIVRQSGGQKGDYGGNSRNYRVALAVAFAQVVVTSLRYPNRATYLAGTPRGPAHDMFFARAGECEDTEMDTVSADDPNGGLMNPLPSQWQTGSNTDLDHPIDLQTMAMFLAFAITGEFPSGGNTNLPLISQNTYESTWRAPNILPPGQPFTSLNDAVMHGYGDETNFQYFVPLRNDVNRMKGRVFGLLEPVSRETFESRLRRAINGDVESFNNVTTTLHTIFATFQYLNSPRYLTNLNTALGNIRNGIVYVENNAPGWQGVTNLWDAWIPNFFQTIVNQQYRWAYDVLNLIVDLLGSRTDSDAQKLLALAATLFEQLSIIQIPGHASPSNF